MHGSRMKRPLALAVAAATLAAVLAGGSSAARAPGAPAAGASASRSLVFSHPRDIDNRYLPLTAHRRCVYRGESTDGVPERTVLTRLDRTRRFTIAGRPVDAAVFSDVAFEGGKHVETAIDYFAQADDGTVYYLGELVSNIKNGKVVDTEGSWLLGRDTDVPGVAMPGTLHVGDRWHFEDVPGVTTESDRVEERDLRIKAAGRIFTGVVRVQEFTQPEGELEYKLYAAGAGIIVSYDPESRTELVGCS
ncbi:MAG: hypothetical protein M3P44_00730 [Actinomycetota bacterium]|nr:hypothetical protein [Actinomycetota bacterium]